jgi:NAD(P)-dependent dehydrogenase (short-subunit alcohol dehydrogenase family)
MDLTGKTALVTGSTRGIGLATAIGLAQMGAEVIVNGRDNNAVGEAVAKVPEGAPSAKVHAAAFDLGNAAGCTALVAQFPDVDILVNNLGIYEPKGFFDIEDTDWTKMFEVNVMSGVRLTRHYLKRMLITRTGAASCSSPASPVSTFRRRWFTTASRSRRNWSSRAARPRRPKGTNVTVNSVMPWSDLGRDGAGSSGRAGRGCGNDRRRPRLAHLQRTPAGVAAAALRHAGRGRQSDLLRLLKSLQRHNGAALRVDGGIVTNPF